MTCSLCGSVRLKRIERAGDPAVYIHCGACDLRFLHPEQRLKRDVERARYDSHRYSVEDQGYAKFVAPLIKVIEREVPQRAAGLDYGAGRVPVLARWLEQRGFNITTYDSFYWPDPAPLDATYDFIVTCEVVEHLFEPGREFARLRAALKPGAPLIIMTDPWRGAGDFHDWYYRRDPTHVSFYSESTFLWIADRFEFLNVEFADRVVCLRTAEEL